jgi:DNA polymerase I-like protein with 3'-5' exonuclease and polymerase domains
MIDLSTAAIVTKLVGDAVGAIDKIYRGFADFNKMKDKPNSAQRPPDFAYVDSPDQKAFVAKSRRTGEVYQSVSYDDLCKKLNGQDRAYIETLTRAMESYQKQWNSVYEQRPMAAGLELARLDAQLDYLAKQIADPLIKVLGFVEKMGLWLDDHYLMARQLANAYLEEGK